jgi:hypothetical protein
MLPKQLGVAASPPAQQPRWRSLGEVVAAVRLAAASNRPTPELARRHDIEDPDIFAQAVRPCRLPAAASQTAGLVGRFEPRVDSGRSAPGPDPRQLAAIRRQRETAAALGRNGCASSNCC